MYVSKKVKDPDNTMCSTAINIQFWFSNEHFH